MEDYKSLKFTTGAYVNYFNNLMSNFKGLKNFKDAEGTFLEIGCGTGKQIFSVATYFPKFSFVGIDISEPNIRICNEALSQIKESKKFRFIQADFCTYEFKQKFEVIFSYGVFQLISEPMDVLLTRTWELLSLNGYFILSMPYKCLYNKFINSIRGILKAIRCKLLDELGIGLAFRLYRKKYSKEFLRERIIYLYQVDRNLLDIHKLNESNKWEVEFQEKTPLPSFIQSQYITVILRKK